MKLYLISQSVNRGYDTYDSAVVAAKTEEDAKRTHPDEYYVYKDGGWAFSPDAEAKYHSSDWALPKEVKVQHIGVTNLDAGVICASFNAG